MSNAIPTAFDHQKSADIFALLTQTAAMHDVDAPDRALINAIFGNSPFLASLAQRHPVEAARFSHATCDYQQEFDEIISILSKPRDVSETDTDLMAFLRMQKSLTSLLLASADISERWPIEQITASLSMFARKCLQLATARAIWNRIKAGDLENPLGNDAVMFDVEELANNCGYFILGMGKLGGGELNYSSDIDLIALYNPQRTVYRGRKSISDCFIKVTQDVVRFIDQRTMHGYVFRVDLRLRPDPGATPVALSVDAAQNYYYCTAVNWERAAMIKASYAAGDQQAANTYLQEMNSWVWRRNMDFEALKDIAAIKNQINRHYDTEEAHFRGYDVKLGVGGIREIEFFAQVNQLLHAGRHPELRLKNTLKTLDALAEIEIISQKTCSELSDAYRYFRRIEHRIQMVNDEQSHTIPADEIALLRLCTFSGYASLSQFEQELKLHTKIVSAHYDFLLPDLEQETTTLSWGNLEQSIQKAGFENTQAALTLIEGWQYGRHRSLKTNRARDLLKECLPGLIVAFSEAQSPDNALARFDHFLAQLPASVQLFSLLKSNPALFRLFGRVMSLAPALSAILAKRPGLWDAVLDSHFFQPIAVGDSMQQDLKVQLSNARDFQDTLDLARRYVAEQKFRAGVQMLEGLAIAGEVGRGLTIVADYTLQQLIPIVEVEFAQKHGRFEGDAHGIIVIALGKYGGHELTHTSDLDIVFLYNETSSDAFSNGPKPLMPNVYYSRLSQHILTAITALTPEGRLFEVDTRLRPSGTQGPLAVTVKTFEDYYLTNAWTWEFLALTRARIIHADTSTAKTIEAVITQAIQKGPAARNILKDTLEMREKLRDQFATNNVWEVKHTSGGLVDIEFICQYLVLTNAHRQANIIQPNTPACLTALSQENMLTPDDAATLLSAYALQQQLQAMLRLCLNEVPLNSADIPEGLKPMLIKASGHKSLRQLEKAVKGAQQKSHAIYEKILNIQ